MLDRDNYLGQQIGNYLVVEKLGSGQFGTVYRAQNKLVAERIVAIKLINNKYVNSQEECERFLQEARLLHGNVRGYLRPWRVLNPEFERPAAPFRDSAPRSWRYGIRCGRS